VNGDPFCVNDCIASQFLLEILAHRFFLSSCFWTLDPADADLFYVPNYSTVARRLRNLNENMSNHSACEPTDLDSTILDIAEDPFNSSAIFKWEQLAGISARWWQRRHGRDHILTNSHPPVDAWKWSRYDTAIKIKNVIWLQLELPKGQVLSDAKRLIIMPYPSENEPWLPIQDRLESEIRDIFMFGRFVIHGSPELRRKLLQLNGTTGLPRVFDQNDNPHHRQIFEKPSIVVTSGANLSVAWQQLIFKSTFCLCPAGKSSTS
jgi:hypothetical protein